MTINFTLKANEHTLALRALTNRVEIFMSMGVNKLWVDVVARAVVFENR